MEVIVLDSSAFYSGFAFTELNLFYTTEDVLKEVSHLRLSKIALESLKIKLDEGKREHLEKVKRMAEVSGDKLSKTDVSVLALGLKLKEENLNPIIISDDYSLCNVATLLGLKVKPAITKGIDKIIYWIYFCGACGKIYREDKGVCEICGSPLKRKPRRKYKKDK
ncbi:tRNA(fMet)-specific endonuclease VapC [archaeon HR06]|nr:tRNA(fMet)-specific endonuclease VapC [archaeon HR06]